VSTGARRVGGDTLALARGAAIWLLGGGVIALAVIYAIRFPAGGPISAAMVGARDFHACRVEGQVFPKRLVDPAGRTRIIAAPPRRIVSAYLGSDEVLAALVEPARVTAVSIYADDPSSSNCLGAFPPPVARIRGESEEILALQPDLVFVTNFTDDGMVRLLEGAGIPLMRFTSWDSFAGVLADIRLSGAVLGVEARAEALAHAVESRLRAVEARVRGRPRPRVVYYEQPGYTRGAGALIDEMIERAGGNNVARELGLRGVAELGFESLLALRPEVVVIPGFGPGSAVPEALAHSAGWAELPAVRSGRVHVVTAASITSISQHAARGLEELARIIHPEAFGTEAFAP
jgi:iron complex transport system substrate-binding protein